MKIEPITNIEAVKIEYAKQQEKLRSNDIKLWVKRIYKDALYSIQTTDKREYIYRTSNSTIPVSYISTIIEYLQKLFPVAIVEFTVYTCSNTKKNHMICKCYGHENCIKIKW